MREAPVTILLSIASEGQAWHRSRTVAGERCPSGRIHAVRGASNRTLCGLDDIELARFPYLDFTTSTLPRCESCRAKAADLLR